ncbi:MAG: hypothetical protein M0R18_02475 [Deltaproteobacteria bacterium]|nr:hypothetical protein [Deltaproteobacteria bacterium]
MKDGFDKSAAEKMPKIQKKRPNRPWNVDPVLIRAQEESRARVAETRQTRKKEKEPGAVQARQARSEGQGPKALPASQAREEAKESETLQAVQKEAAAAAGAADPIVLDPGAPEADPAGNAVSMDKELDALSLNDIRSSGNGDLTKAVETIKDLNSDFTRIVFERKAIQQKLDRSARTIEEVERENTQLRKKISSFERDALDSSLIEREIDFLNEQLEDADLYIQNMMGLLDEKAQNVEQEASLRKDLESRLEKISREIHEKAKLDVKVSILERDLSISHTRLKDLESRLEEEYQKREPLEQEIVELKNALDRVYSSLAHIRLKAKREVYGS